MYGDFQMQILVSVLVLLHVNKWALAAEECSRMDYQRCVKMASPLLTDPKLIFPDTMTHTTEMCSTWDKFVDCVTTYTKRCFTESQQKDFTKAVESPVDLAHQICTEPNYQNEYLRHATCIQSTITQQGVCADYYKNLVGQVLGEVDQRILCCSHKRFRECVLMQTRRQCDGTEDGDDATKFSRQLLDKALGFLQAQCSNHFQKPQDCVGVFPSSHATRNNISNSVHGITDAYTQYQRSTHTSYQARNSPSSYGAMTPTPWEPGRGSPSQHALQATPSALQSTTDDVITNSQTRHPSFARGMSWASSPPTPAYSESNSKPASVDSWKVSSVLDASSRHPTEAWYPTLSSFKGSMSNNVDEPNQQSLSNKNAADSVSFRKFALPFLLLTSAILAGL